MIRKIFFALLLSCCAGVSAQPVYTWSGNLDCYGGGSSASRGVSITVDNSSNVISGGWYTDSLDLDPGAGIAAVRAQGNTAGYVSKLDVNGAFVWGVSIDGPYSTVSSVAVDNSDNVYVAGHFSGTCDFDPGAGVYNLQSNFQDIFIMKLDPAGMLLWAYGIGGNGQDDVEKVVIDGNNDVLMTGVFAVTVDFDPGPGTYLLSSSGRDGYFLKLSSSGAFVCAGAFLSAAMGHNQPWDIDTDPWGNIYVVGLFQGPGTVDFDPGSGQTNSFPVGFTDGFIVKLNAAGQFTWMKKMGFLNYDTYREIEIAENGNLHLFGYFSTTVDLDPGPGTASYTSAGDADPFLCRLDSAGNLLWASVFASATVNPEEIAAIAIDSAGHTYLTGQFDDGTDWDPGAGVTLLPTSWGREVVICAYDTSGGLMWANQLDGTSNNEGFGVATDGASVFYTGSYQDSLDCDPSPANAWLDAPVFQNSFIGKYGNILTGVREEVRADAFITVFPNPTNGELHITSEHNLEEITICDVAGRTVYAEAIENNTRVVQLNLQLTAGMYVISCRDTEGRIITQRFIVR